MAFWNLFKELKKIVKIKIIKKKNYQNKTKVQKWRNFFPRNKFEIWRFKKEKPGILRQNIPYLFIYLYFWRNFAAKNADYSQIWLNYIMDNRQFR